MDERNLNYIKSLSNQSKSSLVGPGFHTYFSWGNMNNYNQPNDEKFLKIKNNISRVNNYQSIGVCWSSFADMLSDAFVISEIIDYNPGISATYLASKYDNSVTCSEGFGLMLMNRILTLTEGFASNSCIDYSWCEGDKTCANSNMAYNSPMLRERVLAPGCYNKDVDHYSYTIKDVLCIDSNTNITRNEIVDAIKAQILIRSPVLFGFPMFENFRERNFWNNEGKKGIYFEGNDAGSERNPIKGYHMMCIVGWGEERILDENNQQQKITYWHCRNTWGEEWGESGYCKIAGFPFNKFCSPEGLTNFANNKILGLNLINKIFKDSTISSHVIMVEVSSFPDITQYSSAVFNKKDFLLMKPLEYYETNEEILANSSYLEEISKENLKDPECFNIPINEMDDNTINICLPAFYFFPESFNKKDFDWSIEFFDNEGFGKYPIKWTSQESQTTTIFSPKSITSTELLNENFNYTPDYPQPSSQQPPQFLPLPYTPYIYPQNPYIQYPYNQQFIPLPPGVRPPPGILPPPGQYYFPPPPINQIQPQTPSSEKRVQKLGRRQIQRSNSETNIKDQNNEIRPQFQSLDGLNLVGNWPINNNIYYGQQLQPTPYTVPINQIQPQTPSSEKRVQKLGRRQIQRSNSETNINHQNNEIRPQFQSLDGLNLVGNWPINNNIYYGQQLQPTPYTVPINQIQPQTPSSEKRVQKLGRRQIQRSNSETNINHQNNEIRNIPQFQSLDGLNLIRNQPQPKSRIVSPKSPNRLSLDQRFSSPIKNISQNSSPSPIHTPPPVPLPRRSIPFKKIPVPTPRFIAETPSYDIPNTSLYDVPKTSLYKKPRTPLLPKNTYSPETSLYDVPGTPIRVPIRDDKNIVNKKDILNIEKENKIRQIQNRSLPEIPNETISSSEHIYNDPVFPVNKNRRLPQPPPLFNNQKNQFIYQEDGYLAPKSPTFAPLLNRTPPTLNNDDLTNSDDKYLRFGNDYEEIRNISNQNEQPLIINKEINGENVIFPYLPTPPPIRPPRRKNKNIVPNYNDVMLNTVDENSLLARRQRLKERQNQLNLNLKIPVDLPTISPLTSTPEQYPTPVEMREEVLRFFPPPERPPRRNKINRNI